MQACTGGTAYYSNSDLNYNLYAYAGKQVKLYTDNLSLLGCMQVSVVPYQSGVTYSHYYLSNEFPSSLVGVYDDCACTTRSPFIINQDEVLPPSPTPSVTPTFTPTPTRTPNVTPTNTATPTQTITNTFSSTPTPDVTPSPTPSNTLYYKLDACIASPSIYTTAVPLIASQRYYDFDNDIYYVWDNTTTTFPGTIVTVAIQYGDSGCPA